MDRRCNIIDRVVLLHSNWLWMPKYLMQKPHAGAMERWNDGTGWETQQDSGTWRVVRYLP